MNASPHILIVEDDAEISRLVGRYLRTNDFHVSVAADGRHLDRLLDDNRVDLIVLDLMLPGEDGLSLCRRLRTHPAVPIIMLTAKGDELDRIIGLEMGADDYLTKPFNPRELLARIRAVLRRVTAGSPAPERRARTLAFMGWQIDCVLRELKDPNGTRIVLTGAEFCLPQVMCEDIVARATARSHPSARGGLARPQHRCPDQPAAPQDGARPARSRDHQDRALGRLSVRAHGRSGVTDA
jgi:two-component system, OmpR family, response regulator